MRLINKLWFEDTHFPYTLNTKSKWVHNIWSYNLMLKCIKIESICIVDDDLGICIALRFHCVCCLPSSKHKLFGTWTTLPPATTTLSFECALRPNLEHVWPPCTFNPTWVNCMHRVVGMRDEGCEEESEVPRQTPRDSFISEHPIYQILRSNTSCCKVVHVLNCTMTAMLVLFEVLSWLSHSNLLICQSMHRLYKSICYLICRHLRINASKFVKECMFSTLFTITKVI